MHVQKKTSMRGIIQTDIGAFGLFPIFISGNFHQRKIPPPTNLDGTAAPIPQHLHATNQPIPYYIPGPAPPGQRLHHREVTQRMEDRRMMVQHPMLAPEHPPPHTHRMYP
ncbi:E3 ubiquitin-protein ligase Arkadia [Manis javanica]|nr:E3 ubiquitin-protein ligase Arkadia [Manis javanica]